MKIYVAGLPGSGKTTQAHKLGEKLNLKVVKMGDILREMSSEESDRGNAIREIMNTGVLLSDEIVAEIIRDEVLKDEYKNGFVMEGYPRTKRQIELFNPEFDKIFVLKVSLEVLLERMKDRGRKDDSPEAIKVRLEEQLAGLKEVLRYYGERVITINGEKSIDEVFEDMMAHLKNEPEVL